jgi:hypothetical protein
MFEWLRRRGFLCGPLTDAAASFPRIIDWCFPAKMMDKDIEYRVLIGVTYACFVGSQTNSDSCARIFKYI